ncbi:MAG: class I SAM-dependent methyltransferase [Planctomycetia bacterium]|nr:class I SAM-dependent methyltransferase [Planctomycetia bacterium]
MFTSEQYELLDFGNGRRLERLGGLILDRPCPAAEDHIAAAPSLWKDVDVRFLLQSGESRIDTFQRGNWIPESDLGSAYFLTRKSTNQDTPPAWNIRHSHPTFILELKGSPFGHIGIFPEQMHNWERIRTLCEEMTQKKGRPARILNLFAYTGGSTLAAAASGAEVVHLDAARNIVQQARKNADLSFKEPRSIRWIVEDAAKFVRRERKRGNHYDGIILDPPTYGHGASGEVWRLSRDLPKLMSDLVHLLEPKDFFVLLTFHAVGPEIKTIPAKVKEVFKNEFTGANQNRLLFSFEPIFIDSAQNEKLTAGHGILIRG